MLNFHLNELVHVLWLLENNRVLPAGQKLSSYSAPLEDQGVISRFEIDGMQQLIAEASKVAKALDLRSTKQRLRLFTLKLQFNMTNADCLTEIKVLQESIKADLVECHFYHYPRSKLEFLMGFYPRWNPIADKFPLVKAEALAATDCYAMGHDTASIFHTMRVAEHGLRALAKERKITLPRDKHIDWGQWQEIIKELNDEIKAIGQKSAGGAGQPPSACNLARSERQPGIIRSHVRDGSISTFLAVGGDFRSSPTNRHRQSWAACLKRAMSRHLSFCSKFAATIYAAAASPRGLTTYSLRIVSVLSTSTSDTS
jgi:hypothetical protein